MSCGPQGRGAHHAGCELARNVARKRATYTERFR